MGKNKSKSAKKRRQKELDRQWEEKFHKKYEEALGGLSTEKGIAPAELTKEQKESLLKHLEKHITMEGFHSSCDGTMVHTVEWIKENIPEDRQENALSAIRKGGGYCDCEVILNYIMGGFSDDDYED